MSEPKINLSHLQSNGLREAQAEHCDPVGCLEERHVRSESDLDRLFAQYRDKLRLMVEMRMDRRVRSRLDPSDVIQETFAEAVQRYPTYIASGKLSPYVWIRFLTLQQLMIAHRKHLGVQSRSVLEEKHIDLMKAIPFDADSVVGCLASDESTPSVKASRNEQLEKLNEAIEGMEGVDREILVMRHFEQMELTEIADSMEMTYDAVSSRYRRALKKLGLAMFGH
jgi:RNA polymerase sigma-70 factor, ECF subfamily